MSLAISSLGNVYAVITSAANQRTSQLLEWGAHGSRTYVSEQNPRIYETRTWDKFNDQQRHREIPFRLNSNCSRLRFNGFRCNDGNEREQGLSNDTVSTFLNFKWLLEIARLLISAAFVIANFVVGI